MKKSLFLIIILIIVLSMYGCAEARVEKEPVILEELPEDEFAENEFTEDDYNRQGSSDQEASTPTLTPVLTPEQTPTHATSSTSDISELIDKDSKAGDTYEGIITLEGMEEKVNYKIYSSKYGYEISYDVDRFSINEADGVIGFIVANPDPNIYPYVYMNISSYKLSEIADISKKQETEVKTQDRLNNPDHIYWDALPDNGDGIIRYVQLKGSELNKLDTLYEIEISGEIAHTYTISLGDEWNSAIRKYYFITHDSYVYKIETQYFVEAEEGFGARLAAMLNTLQLK